jgi:glycosyltransferase involved in cell wall biosynthesis
MEAASGRITVGLARHSGTERVGSGASPGTRQLFSLLEHHLRLRCEVRLLPAYYYGIAASKAITIAADLLAEVDALIVSLPPHPVDLEAIFRVRAALTRRVPIIYLPLGELARGAWFYRCIYHHLTAHDMIWLSSTADRAVFNALVESPSARVCVLPFGIDPAPFEQAVRSRDTIRRQLGIADDRVVFVTHGRVVPDKNVHGVLAVFEQVARYHRWSSLWVIGALPGETGGMPGPRPYTVVPSSPYGDVLVAALPVDIADRVSFWGEVPQAMLWELLGAADVAFNLTLNPDENFGFSTVEAMAAGLPVIGTAWGGLRDTIVHGTTGYLVDTRVTSAGVRFDDRAAAERALELAADAVARRRMGAAAAQRACRDLTIERCTGELVDQVEALLRGPWPERPHRWTALGHELEKQWSAPLSSVLYERYPVPLPTSPDLAAPLAREILRPYATQIGDC